ncbi:MAG: Crp/Fnr family transcriptional regulator [Bacteroidetes bacterium]|nr:MAG: Crp/Fnr family transcriptional regulator [Bacteroidota bacterium]
MADGELISFLNSFDTLTDEEREAIAQNLVVKSYKKGEVLLREGELCDECFFLLKGCLRQYYLTDNDEKTTAFYTEGQAAVSVASYATQTPSKHFVACVEDTTVIVGNLGQEEKMYAKFPKLLTITRSMIEEDYGKTQEDFAAFITSSPEKRYLDLLSNRPELLQRVPQHQIASYLGITPESLSRIRKRVAQKTKPAVG